jgi:hypothetical protein
MVAMTPTPTPQINTIVINVIIMYSPFIYLVIFKAKSEKSLAQLNIRINITIILSEAFEEASTKYTNVMILFC